MSAKPAQPEDILKPLDPCQALAVDPGEHVWLNASAGTGKTQVLAARVLRLLLGGVSPDSILCITFTKAGAAEMAHRVHERLGLWVDCSDGALRTDLLAIGLDPEDAELQARARTLFARVIDSRSGAIRVQTIHSFCQSLLASFPFEAQLLPGFRLIEGGEASDYRRTLLAEMLGTKDEESRRRRDQLGRLSRRLGEQGALAFVDNAARYFALRSAPRLAPASSDVRAVLSLPPGDAAAWVAGQLAAGAIADDDVRHLGEVSRGWGAATGQKIAELCDAWLTAPGADRQSMLPELFGAVARKDGVLKADYGKKLADAADAAQSIANTARTLLATPDWCQLADDLAAGWGLASDFAASLAARKLAEGYAEFDDLIARTAALLADGELADWIRFKLDQRIDHLLIDEAQDTNAAQWTIADGLTGEYFAGLGARDERRLPSMFTVGDRKQAIFSFQGTDPKAFEDARQNFARRAAAGERPFLPVDLATNFRSAKAILEFVDHWLAEGGIAAMGIAPPVADHLAFGNKAGRVELWPPLMVTKTAAEPGEGDEDSEADEKNWSSDDSLRAATDPASLKIAGALADRIAAWVDPAGPGLDGLAVLPQDILVLVRNRRSLAARIVAQLQSRGVAVAGVDRFDLADPLAVQDLLAALRFMVQPDDEYSLAALLVSPLIGWTQQQLYDETAQRGRTPLRQWLAQGHSALAVAANARLDVMRAGSDFATPFRQLDLILSGPLKGRRAMVARLGEEANDAIDALLTAALDYESRAVPSLVGFLDHVDRSELQIKRQTDGRSGLVRVMTVHGSKGLQAPIVILADALSDPLRSDPDARLDLAGWRGLPLFRKIASAAQPPLVATAFLAARQEQLEEHWRLFYVAATRAERLLIVTGAQSGDKDPPPMSWFVAAKTALEAMGAKPVEQPWEGGPALRHDNAAGNWRHPLHSAGSLRVARARQALPAWIAAPVPEEARPPRPLAPSQLGVDDAPQRPAGTDRKGAIRRGVLLHGLIERLPDVAPDTRLAAALRWLARQAPELAETEREAMAVEACVTLAHPDWAAIFGPGSLAEAPFSAVIDSGLVVAGTVDRLLVRDDRVLVVDYKTGAYAPRSAEDVAPAYLRQMAAYAAALAVIFPGRHVAAALLYTAAPRLIALPAALLAAHKPGFDAVKAKLSHAGLEPDGRTS